MPHLFVWRLSRFNQPHHLREGGTAPKVVAVESAGLFRYFEIIDSRDPDCRLKYMEFRNPFRPLSISKGMIVQVAHVQVRGGSTVCLIDRRGRQHNGRLIM